MIRPISITLLMTLLLPPAIFVAFSASSMTPGLMLCALAWCFVGLVTGSSPFTLKRFDSYRLTALFAGVFLLALHAALSNSEIGGVDFEHFFLSCVILIVALIGAHFAAERLVSVPPEHLIQAADLALGFLTMIGLAAAAGLPAIGPQASEKAIVIFSEPSHYSLAYLPMLLFRVSTAKRMTQISLICVALALALLLQSLTMIAGIFMITALLLRSLPFILILAIIGVGSLALDLTYYLNRLTFSTDTTNLSTLVFMQGWDNAILNFKETAGLGVGFQQFGIAGSVGDVADKISAILGESLSLRDGGSTATKLVGEFGILGLVFLVALIRVVLRVGKYIRRCQLQPVATRDKTRLFFCSFIFTYAIELFIRGTGYFSPGGFLAVVGLMALCKSPSIGGGPPKD